MRIEHECDFEIMLLDLAELYNHPQPSKSACGLWWLALEPYPWELVCRALTEHTRSCKWFPRPADVIGILEALDGRPTADEAWALAITATDEAATVVWCREIAQAWGIAQPVLDTGDQIGARRTFIDAYNRLLADARRTLTPASWEVSLGLDASARRIAIEAASRAGRLPPAQARRLLGPIPVDSQEADECAAVAGLLAGNVTALPDLATRNARRFLAAIKAGLEATDQHPAAKPAARRTRAALMAAVDATQGNGALATLAPVHASHSGTDL